MQFMFLVYADEKFYEAMPKPALDEVMAAYDVYVDEMTKAGVLLGGSELASVRKAATVRIRKGKPAITDGPFAETKEHLGGYFLVECANMDEALRWAARCPSAPHGSVEVRPLVQSPGVVEA
jgi:hypothetical protein